MSLGIGLHAHVGIAALGACDCPVRIAYIVFPLYAVTGGFTIPGIGIHQLNEGQGLPPVRRKAADGRHGSPYGGSADIGTVIAGNMDRLSGCVCPDGFSAEPALPALNNAGLAAGHGLGDGRVRIDIPFQVPFVHLAKTVRKGRNLQCAFDGIDLVRSLGLPVKPDEGIKDQPVGQCHPPGSRTAVGKPKGIVVRVILFVRLQIGLDFLKRNVGRFRETFFMIEVVFIQNPENFIRDVLHVRNRIDFIVNRHRLPGLIQDGIPQSRKLIQILFYVPEHPGQDIGRIIIPVITGKGDIKILAGLGDECQLIGVIILECTGDTDLFR